MSPVDELRPLSQALIRLAGTPDDDPQLEQSMQMIAQLTVDEVPAVSYASITMRRAGAYSTVSASSAVATAVDEAQYADADGPCIEALVSGAPRGVPEMGTVMVWPNFRDTAFRLGLRASLSVPLFAGRGETIAALNLYGRDTNLMAPLIAAVWAAFGNPDEPADAQKHPEVLEPNAQALVTGLVGALEVRATIQQAVGVLMSRQQVGSAVAYAQLRLRSRAAGENLVGVATALIAALPPGTRAYD